MDTRDRNRPGPCWWVSICTNQSSPNSSQTQSPAWQSRAQELDFLSTDAVQESAAGLPNSFVNIKLVFTVSVMVVPVVEPVLYLLQTQPPRLISFYESMMFILIRRSSQAISVTRIIASISTFSSRCPKRSRIRFLQRRPFCILQGWGLDNVGWRHEYGSCPRDL